MVASPELTGGAGFTFEDAAVAIYLAALLGEENGPGLPNRVIVRVAVQQAAFGEPLDDLIVDGRAIDEGLARLSLQVKRRLMVSAANNDFREIVLRAWGTVSKRDFRDGVDRVGAVTGTISDDSKRALETMCECARDNATSEAFMARFGIGRLAGQQHRSVLDALRNILSEATKSGTTDVDLHRLLRHFVLIRLDLLHEGSVDEASAVARLRNSLSPDDAGRAGDLWHQLRVIAREAAGHAAEFDRPTLLARLFGTFRFIGAPSLRRDLEKLAEEARLSLATISTGIDGYHVSRPNSIADAERQVRERLFLQITGLPGTGKSAVLRELAESRLGQGPVLVIKSDRIEGRSWPIYAQGLGLVATCLETLLLEIAAVGCPILFIDGLDRIEIQDRGIVIDLINTILNSSTLRAAWRIAATVRDNGIEPLRTWLPAELSQEGGISTLMVKPFDDDEASILAKAKPALRPLLFGEERVREIARRPFFAAVLAVPASHPKSGSLTPRSESELIDAWWARGGCLTTLSMIPHRQRTLLGLARAGAARLGRRIAADNFDINIIEELKRDGILRDAHAGHSVQFVHDIFFEWSFVRLLVSREDAWLEEIQAVGEPPVLGRAVELLSQRTFSSDDNWEQHLVQAEEASMRSQWTRAWLLGPMGAANFGDRAEDLAAAVFWDQAQRLTKLLIWFQAEKTRPNPFILSHRGTIDELSPREIEQAADAYGVPSDYLTWIRCCNWILDNIDRCRTETIPDIVSVLEVWQNGLTGIPNDTSDRIIGQTKKWLEDIEDRQHPEEYRYDRGSWDGLGRGSLEELEERLRALLLPAVRVKSEIVRAYLTRVRTQQQLRHHAFKQILLFAPVLSQTLASDLVDLTLAELKEDLPADVAARPVAAGEFERDFSYHDWDRLAVNGGTQSYFPASPLREPFASLFNNVPNEARRLVRDLTNHAITAWRQLFDLDWERRATPIALTLNFPWGQQVFWGEGRVYRWFRGHGAPHAVEAGLMALEQWAFREVEKGRAVDEVICDVVSGHESVAVLGIAVALALTAGRASRTTLPLVTSQRLWHWDLERFVNDRSSRANLIGFINPADRRHADAVRESNDRTARQLEVRSLAPLFALGSDDGLRKAAQAAIQGFPEDLPFDFEEERQNEKRTDALRRTAEIWAEYGNKENYSATRAEDGKGVYIQLNNPRATDPDMIAAAQQHEVLNQGLEILNWVHDCFEQNRLSDKLPISRALEGAKRLDAPDLFTEPYNGAVLIDHPQKIVSGVAAAVLAFSEDLHASHLSWAEDVVLRAAETPEDQNDLWFSGAVHLDHPCLWAVRGLAALVRQEGAPSNVKRALIRLAGHPLEQVSQAAIGAAFAAWDEDPAFAWATLDLGLRLSVGNALEERSSPRRFDHVSHSARVRPAIEDAIGALDRPTSLPPTSLQSIPAAWVYAPPMPREHLVGRPRSSDPVWRDPDAFLRWDFLPKVLGAVPIERVLSDASRRPAFLELCDQLVAWTIERLNPPWDSDGTDRSERRASDLIGWCSFFYGFLAGVAQHLDQDEARRRYLEPVFALDDELAAQLIRPFADRVVCAIMDAPVIEPRAIALLDACLQRVLRHKDWSRARKYDGKVHGFDLPELIQTFLFVHVEYAGGAAHFANGDWHEVEHILPIIDPFVRAFGDLPRVTSSFLTLCERAADHYPPDQFVRQINTVLEKQPGTPVGWRGSLNQGRIAALIQAFAQQTQPLPLPLAQSMLRILDRLIDMGDRRSAALQTSEIFKNVKIEEGGPDNALPQRRGFAALVERRSARSAGQQPEARLRQPRNFPWRP
jgi:hypothetical protein